MANNYLIINGKMEFNRSFRNPVLKRIGRSVRTLLITANIMPKERDVKLFHPGGRGLGACPSRIHPHFDGHFFIG